MKFEYFTLLWSNVIYYMYNYYEYNNDGQVWVYAAYQIIYVLCVPYIFPQSHSINIININCMQNCRIVRIFKSQYFVVHFTVVNGGRFMCAPKLIV